MDVHEMSMMNRKKDAKKKCLLETYHPDIRLQYDDIPIRSVFKTYPTSFIKEKTSLEPAGI